MFSRSFLFVPSHEERYFLSAKNASADYIVLDIEDSVPENLKNFARKGIKKKISSLKNKNVLVRLNQYSKLSDFEISCCVDDNTKGFVLSKIKNKKDILNYIKIIKKKFRSKYKQIELYPLIENTKSIMNINEIIKTSKNIRGCIFGHEDYLVDTKGDITINMNALIYARSKVVNYCRANNINPIDMAYLDIKNMIGCKNFCLESKSLGFTGMIAVYPRQVPTINEIFSPSGEDIKKAKKIVTLSEEKKDNIFLDKKGNYVGPPHLKKAKNILSYARKLKKN